MIELGAVALAKAIKARLVENLVEALVERVTGRRWQLGLVPQSLLSLSKLPPTHRHTSSVRSKHSQRYMFLDFRHGLLVLLCYKT
jgi:hypothetical protein